MGNYSCISDFNSNEVRDTDCAMKCITTCDIYKHLTFRIQTENFMSSLSGPNSMEDTISADFVFVPSYDWPNNSVLKSYSGDIFKMKDEKHWMTIKADGNSFLETEVSGFPLGIVKWSTSNAATAIKGNKAGIMIDL